MTDQPLRVLHVEPAQGAVDPKRCPLVLQLSRPVDRFEEAALKQHIGVVVDDQDKMVAYWPDVNLEEFARNPGNLSGKVMNAAGFGRQAREAAQRGAASIDTLIDQINAGLQ